MAEEKKNPFDEMSDDELRRLAVDKGILEGTSKTESVIRGAAQGATLGFADEITAGIESALTDKTFDESLEESRRNYKVAEEDNPVSYNAGDIGGSIAGAVALPGGIAAKTAGNIALGAAAGVGRSEDKSIGDAALGAAFGAAGDVAGKIAGKALKKTGEFATRQLTRLQKVQTFEAMGADTGGAVKSMLSKLQSKGITGEKQNKFLNWMLNEEGVFVNEIGEETQEKLLSGSADLRTNYDKIVKYAYDDNSGVGKQIGDFIKQADTELDAQSIKQQLMSSLEANIDEVDGVTAKAIREVQKEIEATPAFQKEMLSLSQLQKIKGNMAKSINFEGVAGSKGLQQQRRVAVDNLTRMIEDSVESGLDDTAKAAFVQAKGNYRNALTAIDLMEGAAMKEVGVMGHLKDLISVRGTLLGVSSLALTGNPLIATGLSIAANKGLKSTTMPAAAARLLNGRAMNKLLDGMRMGLPKFEKIGQRIVAASTRSIDAFSHEVESSLGQVSLEDMPLTRNSEEAFNRAHEIIPVVRNLDPTLADAMEQAVENEDKELMGNMLHGLSNLPQARKMINPGIGWDGRAVTPEEIEMVRGNIKQSKLPYSVRLQLLRDFDKTSLIPELASLEAAVVPANKQDALKPRESGRKVERY